MCFVIFMLVAAKSPLRSRVHIHCSYFDDPQVHQTQHIQNWTCVPPKHACLSFILSLIHLVSQHRFIYYLWWSRQCSRHQGCKVEKTGWLQGDLCLVYFLPLPISLMAWGLPRQSPLCIIPHFILHVLSVLSLFVAEPAHRLWNGSWFTWGEWYGLLTQEISVV